MKKVGFVTPWYGDNIPGGAETELRGLVKHLHQGGMKLEVLSTCVKQFASNWSINFHPSGCTIENGIPVRRFRVRKRDAVAFETLNCKLMSGIPLTDEEEYLYIRETINSPDLYDWLRNNVNDYSVFVFIPYMFGTTYYGLSINPEKSILIPCFHNESYIYMRIFKNLFPFIKGMLFHSEPEMHLAERIYNLSSVYKVVIGEGVDTDIRCDPAAFLLKYKISSPFILYAGRKDMGKNVDMLLEYFSYYKQNNKNDLLLILIGGGEIRIPNEIQKDVVDLGFVPVLDKFNAYAAALLLCQPSINESFSLVIMESWICGRPVLIHTDCQVTKHFVHTSNGGLYFKTYQEFEGCVNYILTHNETASKMGKMGHDFVQSNFSWDYITDKYLGIISKLRAPLKTLF
jgi:glycosyltransferase involved in cell wall biosynthesis